VPLRCSLETLCMLFSETAMPSLQYAASWRGFCLWGRVLDDPSCGASVITKGSLSPSLTCSVAEVVQDLGECCHHLVKYP
jgi:hypothetical protein